MPVDRSKLEITQKDLLGYTPDQLRCRMCRGACGLRMGLVCDGRALVMCADKPETQAVLAQTGR